MKKVNKVMFILMWIISILGVIGILLLVLFEFLLLHLPNKIIIFLKKKSYDKVFHSERKVQKRERQGQD